MLHEERRVFEQALYVFRRLRAVETDTFAESQTLYLVHAHRVKRAVAHYVQRAVRALAAHRSERSDRKVRSLLFHQPTDRDQSTSFSRALLEILWVNPVRGHI
jgi:hypothetical protein